MKIKLNIFIISSLLLITFNSCNKKLDINVDPNSPTKVTEKLMLPAILSYFSYEVSGGWLVRTTSLWTKHLAYATAGPHEGNYRLTANDTDNFWKFNSYLDVMENCKVLISLANENGNPSYSAIAKILLAWNLSMVTDVFGDIPYSDAFNATGGVIKPKYDTQEAIYDEIQKLLDEATTEANLGTGETPSSDDFIYQGTMSSWEHLARTLKARFFLRLSNAPGHDAAAQANLALEALNAGAITSDETPAFAYYDKAGEENPWYQYAIDGKWSTTSRPSIYYINLLSTTNDPRIAVQATKVPSGVNAGKYVGVTNDAPPLALVNYSAIAPFYSAADAPLYWFIYAEVPFIRAEAEFLKANKVVTASVKDAYQDGIVASMEFSGIKEDDYKSYLSANALKSDPALAYKQIITQKFIANYLQFEPYNDYRRTGYPELTINNEVYPGAEIDIEPQLPIIPLRMPYPASERSYNNDNIPAGISASPAEAMQIPVWWDN